MFRSSGENFGPINLSTCDQLQRGLPYEEWDPLLLILVFM